MTEKHEGAAELAALIPPYRKATPEEIELVKSITTLTIWAMKELPANEYREEGLMHLKSARDFLTMAIITGAKQE